MTIRFISAGAGSGKTFRLTELLSARLAQGSVRPEAVIATTFTRRAAAELVDRVRQRLVAEGQALAAVAMGQALIGTVNGVCGQLLARYAFEAGLAPRLEVLAEEQQPALFAQAIELATTSGDIRAMNALAARLGLDDWQANVRKLVDLSRANDIAAEALVGQGERSVAELLAFLPPPDVGDLDSELARAVADAIAAIAGNGDGTQVTRNYLDLLQAAAHGLRDGSMPWSGWVGLAKKRPGVRSEPHTKAVTRAALRYDRHPRLHADVAEWVDRLFAMAARACATYQQLKAERGLIDFVDQEREVLRLLDRSDVAEALRAELDLLLVDEFQDTSPIQLALFLKLASLARECIWVGDVKQAIYGFRGADPALMAAVVAQLERAGDAVEVLDRSWRSRPGLVALTNALFVPAFSPQLPVQQVRLTAQRSEILDHPPLRVWHLEGATVDARASALASGIQRLLSGGIQVVDGVTGARRAVRPGDVAVLSRTNEGAQRFAAVLTAAGIAASLEQPGLLSTPEAYLTLACLRRLVDPGDTLASAEIIALKREGPTEAWLEDRLAYLAEGRPSTRWGIDGSLREPVLVVLDGLRARLAYLAPSEVLDDVLATADLRADARAWGPTPARSAQRLANLETLRGLAADYEEQRRSLRGSATLAGFVLWLRDLADSERDLKAVDSGIDAVRVLTHHGAKGLEWPVVIAADLESAIRGRLWEPTVIDDAASLDLGAPLRGRRLRYWPWPFGAHEKGIAVLSSVAQSDAGRFDQQAQRAEAIRLLYVSLTRARDLLVLPLAAGDGPRPWLDTLAADWLTRDADGVVRLPDGSTVACLHEAPAAPAGRAGPPAGAAEAWFPPPAAATPRLPAWVSPSAQGPLTSARVGRVVDVGPRLALPDGLDAVAAGDAVHAILAAELTDPARGDRREVAARLLAAHGIDAGAADELLGAADRLRACLDRMFRPHRALAEWPVTGLLETGQRLAGWIDLLLDTPDGWVIVDHKTHLGPRTQWSEQALAYSGQLAAYAGAVEQATGRPVLGTWVHFPVGGGLVEVEWAAEKPGCTG
jgi:ATP-dependent exoDNAse (exonuclease V) beta subunit